MSEGEKERREKERRRECNQKSGFLPEKPL